MRAPSGSTDGEVVRGPHEKEAWTGQSSCPPLRCERAGTLCGPTRLDFSQEGSWLPRGSGLESCALLGAPVEGELQRHQEGHPKPRCTGPTCST